MTTHRITIGAAAWGLTIGGCSFSPDSTCVNEVHYCDGTVGRYSDGYHPGSTAAFREAYQKRYPQLGCPFNDNGDGGYVREVCNGLDLQSFMQSDARLSITSNGQTVLMLDPGLGQAFLVHGEFWLAYACLDETGAGDTGVGGCSLLGAPTSERYTQRGTVRQDFAKGSMTLDGESGKIAIHLNEHRKIDPDLLARCEMIEAISFSPTVCAQPVAFVDANPTQSDTTTVPSCGLNENGAVVLEYTESGCSPDSREWRGCEFAWNQNLSPFDPLGGNGGAYEVFFCIEGPVNGAVNIWYQQEEDCEDCRRFLPLLTTDDPLQGCQRVYIGPGDVSRNLPWGPNRYCYGRDTASGACITDADTGVGGTPSSEGGVGGAGGADTDGAAGESAQSRPDFAMSKLVLMNEWCSPDQTTEEGPVRITIESVIYHPAGCLCFTDQDCQQPAFCQLISWPEGACCECEGCPGVCQ